MNKITIGSNIVEISALPTLLRLAILIELPAVG
jgi:hypothetical protein